MRQTWVHRKITVALCIVKECDRISLVTYDTEVELVFGLMKMDKPSKERARAFVESIRDGSSTNLCGGLLKGYFNFSSAKSAMFIP